MTSLSLHLLLVLFNKLQEDEPLISVPDSHAATLMREPRKTKTGLGKEEGRIRRCVHTSPVCVCYLSLKTLM